MSDSLGLAAGAVALAIGLCTLVGLVVRYALLPYLREQLQLNREIHQQVVTTEPSSPAEPSTMREELTQLGGEIEDATLELRAMALMFDGHLEWSQEEVDRIWAELNRQRAAGVRPQDRHTRKHRKDTL